MRRLEVEVVLGHAGVDGQRQASAHVAPREVELDQPVEVGQLRVHPALVVADHERPQATLEAECS
jgi:hypothetical protein